jgi:hypothetical protein
MLSKRGKANGKATANKRPRTARANQKSKAPARRPRTAGAGPRKGTRSTYGASKSMRSPMTAPVIMGLIQRNSMFRWRFGAAAPHDEFPEGGIKICGVLPGSSDTATLTQDTTNPGLFGTAGATGAAVNPT